MTKCSMTISHRVKIIWSFIYLKSAFDKSILVYFIGIHDLYTFSGSEHAVKDDIWSFIITLCRFRSFLFWFFLFFLYFLLWVKGCSIFIAFFNSQIDLAFIVALVPTVGVVVLLYQAKWVGFGVFILIDWKFEFFESMMSIILRFRFLFIAKINFFDFVFIKWQMVWVLFDWLFP